VSDSPTEPPIIDRRQDVSHVTVDDRPGIVASLLRYRMIVVAATLFGTVAGYALAHQLPVRYRAEAVLILADPGGPSVVGGDALPSEDREVYLAKQADIMSSRVVLERALELLGSDRPVEDARDHLDVQPATNLASVSVVATESDPESAADLANAVATAYEQITEEDAAADASRAIERLEQLRNRYQESLDAIARSPDGRLTSRQQQLAGVIADLQQREQDITAQAAVYESGVEYFERAEPPTAPSQPRPKLAALLGGLLGFLAASAWAWWAAARGQRAEARGEPARILEAPLLGEVSRRRDPPLTTSEFVAPPALDPGVEDAYRFIVVSIEHELAGIGGKSIAVTSVGACNCKTSTALQIANAASQEKRKILLIDADLRTPRLSERVGPGKVASEHNGKMPTMRRVSTGASRYVDRLVSTDSGMVLPIASSDVDAQAPSGPFGAVVVRDAVQAIGQMFDLVLIDSPALTSVNALGVAGQADGVVLIVPHRVALSALQDVRARLDRVSTPLIGYVYVRPRALDARSLWGRVTQPLLRTSARRR
jgi:Mrp family chromosome partitioning ATPase